MSANNNRKNSGSNRSTNDAATPIVNHKTVGRNTSKYEEAESASTSARSEDSTSDYVSGDASRSSSSHQFHKNSEQ